MEDRKTEEILADELLKDDDAVSAEIEIETEEDKEASAEKEAGAETENPDAEASEENGKSDTEKKGFFGRKKEKKGPQG